VLVRQLAAAGVQQPRTTDDRAAYRGNLSPASIDNTIILASHMLSQTERGSISTVILAQLVMVNQARLEEFWSV